MNYILPGGVAGEGGEWGESKEGWGRGLRSIDSRER